MTRERNLTTYNKIRWIAAPVSRLHGAERRLEWRKLLGLYPPFVPYTPEQRTSPETVMSDADSAIMVAVPYWHPLDAAVQDSQGKQNYPVSRSAWGVDYHQVVFEILQALLVEVIGEEAAERAHVQVDSGPLEERAFAGSLELGHSRANGAIFVPPFGSWVFLGIALTDVNLSRMGNVTGSDTNTNDCEDCHQCVRSCPTGALMAPYRINWHRCLSYLTQKRGFLPRALRRAFGGRLFGCDSCQLACPDNRHPERGLTAFAPDEDDLRPDLIRILGMTEDEFAEAYGDKSFAWRGRRTIQRNALIALGNTAGPECLSQLIECLADRRPVIRGYATWAIGRILQRTSGSACCKVKRQIFAMSSDEHPQVRTEADVVLTRLR